MSRPRDARFQRGDLVYVERRYRWGPATFVVERREYDPVVGWMYGTERSPLTAEHLLTLAATVDACSARALRAVLPIVLRDIRDLPRDRSALDALLAQARAEQRAKDVRALNAMAERFRKQSLRFKKGGKHELGFANELAAAALEDMAVAIRRQED